MMFRPRAALGLLAVLLAAMPALATPFVDSPLADEVMYHFMPIAWRDSDGDPQRFGDFGGMTASLDYLEDLGITSVWINPIFPSPAYHGYHHGPADQINSRLGDEAGFLAFVDAAHARGIKVFVDLVVYGISHSSTWYQSAFGNPASPYDSWLAFTNGANTNYLGAVYTTWNGSSVGFIHWNLNSPDATALVTGWSQYWLDPDGDGDPSDGIDGYRLDHVWERYNSGPNGWGYNLEWWEQWKADLQSVNPDVVIFAEQADWGINGVNLLSAFDASFTKPLEFAARDALANETASPLYGAVATTVASMPAGRAFLGIIGDHDVDRLASVIGSSFDKGKLAATLHMTLPFPPIVYFGDEIGMLGIKQSYGSDANDIPMREPFKWNAVAGPPMTDYWSISSNPSVLSNAFSGDNDGRSVEEQEGVAGSQLEHYRTMIGVRHDHAALRRGSYHPVTTSSSFVYAFLRYLEGEECLLVVLNMRSGSRSPSLNLSATDIPGGSTSVTDVVTGQSLSNITDANKSAYSITLPSYGYRVLSVDLSPVEVGSGIDGRNIPSDVGEEFLVATQDNATGLGDNISELNQLFVRPAGNGIHVGITGNMSTENRALALVFDTVPGGQQVLSTSNLGAPPAGLAQLDGLTFDVGFEADYMYFINLFGGNIFVDRVTLPTVGSSTKSYRGSGTVNDGDGILSGGSNPNGLQVAMHNSNAAGVTSTSAVEAATATRGFEMFVPFADIGVGGHPRGEGRLVAFILRQNGEVGNQWLPGLGGGWPNLGVAPDLAVNVPGDQFAVVSLDLRGDGDGDGDVDADDYPFLFGCITGPNAGSVGPGCGIFDFEGDLDVDLEDMARFLELAGS